ncbi:MAG: hypothetical protein ACXWVH_09750 [Caulobacteraceae bacterium]
MDLETPIDAVAKPGHSGAVEGAAMLNLDLLKRSLGWYGAAWLSAFGAVLGGTWLCNVLPGVGLIKGADWLLAGALIGLALAMAAFLIRLLAGPESARTKIVLTIFALLLLIPLLWAPVLGAKLAAAIAGAPIEYSSVYAGFRIAFGKAFYAVTVGFLGDPRVEAAWAFFQAVSTVVGFAAALGQAWRMLKGMAGGERTA